MVMSDPLSRAFLNEPPSQAEYCHLLEQIVVVDDLPISDARLNSFRKATACDANLQILMSTVLGEWLRMEFLKKSSLTSPAEKTLLSKMVCCSRVNVSLYPPS